MRKAVIIIAAGNNQVLVIKKAKKMGFAVICIDRDPNAIGFQFCDEKINLSTYESKPIIAYLKKLQKKYEFFGVINRSSGIPVITCAEICSTFKLPGINPTAAKNIIDKSELMSFCKINNISAPFSISARIFAEIDNKSIKFPCIVKPALSIIGKSGVVMVKNEEELEIAFNIAQKSSINGIVDIEEYVKGYDITLMAIVRNGVIYPITLLDEINSIDDNGKIFGIGFAVPSIFSGRQEEDKILSLAQKIVRAFKLDTTVFLISCRCDFGQNPKLIEIHLDFGGILF